MAYYAKCLSFLLFAFVFTSLHIEARESKFFTKLISHNSNSINDNSYNTKDSSVPLLEAPTPSPAPAQEPSAEVFAPAPAHEIEYGYGLYGHGSSDEFHPTKTTTTNTIFANEENDEIPTEELSTQGYKEENTEYPYNNNNNGYSSYNYNNNNNGYTNNYNNNGYETERQGMSDTRFLENGKYYYDVNSENYYQSGYGSVKGSNNNGGYYGNAENSKYEFNTREEYERQEGYPENQGKYFP